MMNLLLKRKIDNQTCKLCLKETQKLLRLILQPNSQRKYRVYHLCIFVYIHKCKEIHIFNEIVFLSIYSESSDQIKDVKKLIFTSNKKDEDMVDLDSKDHKYNV